MTVPNNLRDNHIVVHLEQCSLKFNMAFNKKVTLVRGALSRCPDILGLTEMGTTETERAVSLACRLSGFQFVNGSGDGGFAVRRGIKVLSHGAKLAHKGSPGPRRKGGFRPRYVNWIHVEHDRERYYVHEGHWISSWSETKERTLMHTKMTETIAELTQEHGRGTNISFWQGDTNLDDAKDIPRYDEILKKHDLISVFDETEEWPNTERGRTIDIIGYYQNDNRVRLSQVRVWPHVTTEDHKQVSAWFVVRRLAA